MLKIKKKARFITDFYGSAPCGGALKTVLNWIDKTQMKGLMDFAAQTVKKGMQAEENLENILSVFHRDKNNCPVLGNWMLQRCLVVTGQTIFNAQKNRDHPKRDIIKPAVLPPEPVPHISIYNGDLLKKPDGVETYSVSIKYPQKSFFKAYEYIKAGATFECTMYFDDDLIGKKYIEEMIKGAPRIGVGAFRDRFGKFEWV